MAAAVSSGIWQQFASILSTVGGNVAGAFTEGYSYSAGMGELMNQLMALRLDRQKIIKTIGDIEAERDREIQQAQDRLDEAATELTAEISEEEEEYTRKETQALEAKGLEMTQLEDEIIDAEASLIVIEADYNRALEDLEERYNDDLDALNNKRDQAKILHDAAIAKIETSLKNLLDNYTDQIADFDRLMQDLKDTYELDLEHIDAQEADADTELEQTIEQTRAKEARTVDDTRKTSIIGMREAGQAGMYQVGKVSFEERLKVATKKAAMAASGIRPSGSPLLAMRQAERVRSEAVTRAKQKSDNQLEGMATSTAAKIEGIRADADDTVENAILKNTLFDNELDRRRETLQDRYENEYENFEDSKKDAERIYKQEKQAYEAERKAENDLYANQTEGFDIEEDTLLTNYTNDQETLEADYQKGQDDISDEIRGYENQIEDLELNTDQYIEDLATTRDQAIDELNDAYNTLESTTEDTIEDLEANATLLTQDAEFKLNKLDLQENTINATAEALHDSTVVSSIARFFLA